MSTERNSLSATLITIDPDSIKLDGRGRFEISEIFNVDLLEGISGGFFDTNSNCGKSCTGGTY